MEQAETIEGWNRRYDALPGNWKFHAIFWPLIVVSLVNMILTIAIGFPFALLLLVAIAVLAYVRVPYAAGMIHRDAARPEGSQTTVRLGRMDWVWNLNQWFDAEPAVVRYWMMPAILIGVGLINMILTMTISFPFGLLFLIALLFIIFVRGTYAAGWLTAPEAPALPGGAAPMIAQEHRAAATTIDAGPRPEPSPVATPAPAFGSEARP